MYFHKVTIAAIFICQLTLVPETLMSNNQAIFHVAINSLNSISENCSDKSTDIKKTYSLAISDLTSVFYQQNQKINELEVDNVYLKDEIEYLKEKLSKGGKKLHSRVKREPRLEEYKPRKTSQHRKHKKSDEQQRKNRDDYLDSANKGVIQEVSNSLLPSEKIGHGGRDQHSKRNIRHSPGHQYGFYDVFNVPNKPTEEQKQIKVKPRSEPSTQFRQLTPGSKEIDPTNILVIDENGKPTRMKMVQPNPGGVCQLVPIPERKVKIISTTPKTSPVTKEPVICVEDHEKKRKEPIKHMEDPTVHVNLVTPEPSVHVNFLRPTGSHPPAGNSIQVQYVGVEEDSSDDNDYYLVYPPGNEDLYPERGGLGYEEMVLDQLPHGPWDSHQVIEPIEIERDFPDNIYQEDVSKKKKYSENIERGRPPNKLEYLPDVHGPPSNEPKSSTQCLREGICKYPGGMIFITSLTFPGQLAPLQSRPIADQDQGLNAKNCEENVGMPGMKQGLNVFGNYIALSMQNQESQSANHGKYENPTENNKSSEKQDSNTKLSSKKDKNVKARELPIEEDDIEEKGEGEEEEYEYVKVKPKDKEDSPTRKLRSKKKKNKKAGDLLIEDDSSTRKLRSKKNKNIKTRGLSIEEESICPQLHNQNDSFCNCTPCNEFVPLLHPGCKHFNGRSSLHEVIKLGCSKLVNKIIEKANVNEINDDGVTPLHIAAERGYTDVINILFQAGANINAVDNHSNTALHYCATGGSANACRLLLSKRSDVKAQNMDQATPLHIAVWKGNYEIVNMLLNYNDSFEITDNFGRSPMDLAREMNYDYIIELLEKRGIKSKNPPMTQNTCGRYPSDRSSVSNEFTSCGITSFRSNNISNSNNSVTTATTTMNPTKEGTILTTSTNGETLTQKEESSRKLSEDEKELFEVSKGNNWLGSSALKLCAKGMNVNVKDIDSNSSTALHFAASIGVKLTTLILIRCGADVNVKDINGNTPLHLAVMNGKYWIADILLHNKANPFAANTKGETPQKLAQSRPEFGIRGLFDARVLRWYNPERKLKREEVMIHKWAKEGYFLGISLKCAEGNDINIKNIEDNLSTALHLAVSASKNNIETVLTLLRCGSDIHSLDADGNTPLHLAVLNKQADVVITLLMKYADPLVPNKDGKTAYQLAQVSDDPLIRDTFTSQKYSWYMRHPFDSIE